MLANEKAAHGAAQPEPAGRVVPITITDDRFVLMDSGNRRQFATGAVRDVDDSKPRPDLISPFALMRVGKWLALGAQKYGERNWEKGIPFSVCFASLIRHALKYAMGMHDEDHLAAVVFNAQALLHFEETERADLDDMPRYRG